MEKDTLTIQTGFIVSLKAKIGISVIKYFRVTQISISLTHRVLK